MREGSFEGLLEWAKEKPNTRLVKVDIKQGIAQAWCYDIQIKCGQFAQSADEIDLVSVRKRELERAVEELAAIENMEG